MIRLLPVLPDRGLKRVLCCGECAQCWHLNNRCCFEDEQEWNLAGGTGPENLFSPFRGITRG